MFSCGKTLEKSVSLLLKKCEKVDENVKNSVQKFTTTIVCLWNSVVQCETVGKNYTNRLFILPLFIESFPEFTQTSTITTTYYKERKLITKNFYKLIGGGICR